MSQGTASRKLASGGWLLSRGVGSWLLSVLCSPVQLIAAAAVIRREPEKLSPRRRQPSLAGEVSNLASQPTVIGAVGQTGRQLG